MYISRYGDCVFAKNWKEFSSREMEVTEQSSINKFLREKMKLPSTSSPQPPALNQGLHFIEIRKLKERQEKLNSAG